MAYTLKIFSFMVVGIAIGILINRNTKKTGNQFERLSKISGKIQMAVVIYLLFILGVNIGSNEQVFAELDTLWLIALVITVASMGLGLLFMYAARKFFKFNKEGMKLDD